mmetsp:Transcript_978/g.1394  ORF Transcript_978/g.1394 Transcript_978/m.1394 type:complete len:199 (-) Transcript_978:226-822(-)|eukprot:CAMPEP_0196579732 /NCGR_PEP_ID=MMETSP1081-20130531/24481_1 /TAXON_ID=36882 /ORGANISM="Pyramimonas amylifera, Strain CCMP720" /LENGTH=198 /DNA_ID=CAMNT_0041899397 /DNA_START=12 /DNA_END=608 /DNA_ORIENTATION=-
MSPIAIDVEKKDTSDKTTADSTNFLEATTNSTKALPVGKSKSKPEKTFIPSNEEASRIIKDFEVKIRYMNSIKEKKRKQLKADLEELKFIDSEIENTVPKVEALSLVIDLKERKQKTMEDIIQKKTLELAGIAESTSKLVQNMRTAGRRLERIMATANSEECKGYSTSTSVADLRHGITRTPNSNDKKKPLGGSFAVV